MSIQFIRSNPADDSWDRMQARINDRRDRQQARGIDEALRSGVQDMYGQREGMANEQPSNRRVAGLSGVRANPEPQSSGFNNQPTQSADQARELTGRGPSAAPPDRDQFIQSLLPEAMRISQETGLDPRLIIAQAAQETGWGRSAPGNNYFGIKSHGQPGGEQYATTEYIDGERQQTRDSFRQYGSPEESVRGYSQFLQENPRYGEMLSAPDLDSQVDALGRSGYATDPNYAQSVGSIARGLDLDQYQAQQQPRQQPQQPQQRGGISSVQAQPQGGMYDPVIERLSQTPGGGQAAFQLYQGQQQSAAEAQQARQQSYDGLVENAMTALAQDNIEGFQFYAQQAGILDQFPPQVLQDANMRRLIGQGSLLAETVYSADDEQGGVFMQAYLQSGGNAQQAFLTAGRPQSRPNYDIRELMTDEGAVLARIDPRGGTAEPITMGEGEIARPTGSGDGSTATIRDHQFWTSLGYSQDEATRLVTEAKFNARGVAAQQAESIVRAEMQNLRDPLSPDEFEARYQEVFNFILRNIQGGPAGEQSPQAAQPAPTVDFIVE